ncbi:MAG TPA: alpha/beta fold hydrolase [Chthoniobacter sp.]|jgi:pimeloyl-ACP methyl ester carboxylesterase
MQKTLLGLCAALFFATLPVRADDFDSAGVKIHYIVEGAGQPVILIHGLYASAEMNWGFNGVIGELTRHYRVIALDCRGHGASDKPANEGDYGIKMVDDVVRLMDHLNVQSANIVGYSMGGMIGLKLAVTHPDRVHSLVLGGMGMMKEGSPLQQVWENMGGRKALAKGANPAALLHGFPEFAVTEDQVRALKIPISVVVGEKDPCRAMYVAPLLEIRPEIPVQVVPGVGHIACVLKPEFKTDIDAALSKNLASR